MPLLPRRAFLLAAAGTALGAGFARLSIAAEAKLSKGEWQAIRKVILEQLVALKAGNADKAFGYAAPGIRAQATRRRLADHRLSDRAVDRAGGVKRPRINRTSTCAALPSPPAGGA
jgi:hypothetical protein